MHINIKTVLAAVLLLVMCLSVAACRQKTTPDSTNRPSTDQTENWDTQTGEPTEETQETHGIITQDPTAPSLDVETDVSNDRGEMSGSDSAPQEQTKPTVPEATTPQTEPDTTLSMNYQQYMSLTGRQQQELYDKYFSDDPLAFAAWFQKLKAEYEDETPEIIATGPVDIGDYITP